jgi:1-pyrroline-5-carboxylate dehydrogenase
VLAHVLNEDGLADGWGKAVHRGLHVSGIHGDHPLASTSVGIGGEDSASPPKRSPRGLPRVGTMTAARTYALGSPECAKTAAALAEIRAAGFDVANDIGPRQVRTGRTAPIVVPHEHAVHLGQVHHASATQVADAIAAATETARWWRPLSWEERAAPVLRGADMLEHGPWRDRLVAATMLEMSKTTYQADGDAACETADFIRANVTNLRAMSEVQPESPPGVHNHVQYLPLEGFVLAITPFNFVSMNNLAFGPALLGNTVVWKPAENASLIGHLSLLLLREAGLPDGVVNIVYGDGAELGLVALRGAYEYQGQKCSAVSRLYAPRSRWPALRERLVELTRDVVVGDPTLPQT